MHAESLPEVHYSVGFPDGPEGPWLVVAYTCAEELSGGCNTVLDLASENTQLELSTFLGSTCELSLVRGDNLPQHVFGIVSRVDLLGRVDHHVVVRVHVTSAFELGRLQTNSRIWQDTAPLDVVKAVLDPLLAAYGRTYTADTLSRGSEARTYCVQYRETDYDFVRRLLEEEGISYIFVHDADVGHEVLTLRDNNGGYAAAENVDGSPLFPMLGHGGEQAEFESLQDLEWSQQLTTTAVLRRDYDWRQPKPLLSATADGTDQRKQTRRAYDHLGRRFERDDLDERARDLVHALALSGSVARGRSNALGLRSGARFCTDAHSESGAPEEYIITRVRHRGSDPAAANFPLATLDTVYANEFECVAADREIRPLPLTSKPDVRGAQTATVVGDGEIHTDAHGRIQVQFHWEESPTYATGASCWIRCAQSWAGSGFGAQFIPRVGMEVVVEFIEGNPDRPLVVGCVYNGDHSHPFAPPDSSTQSGWRTNSSPGGGGSNELRFEDAAGAEQIYIHGQKDWRIEIEHDTARSTGNDERLSVGHDFGKSVGNDQSESVGANKSIVVGANHDETIGQGMTLTVGSFSPGEGAAFVVLATGELQRHFGDQALGTILGVGSAVEPAAIKTDGETLGVWLARAVEQAATMARPGVLKVGSLYCDLNGERYRSDEWGFVALRCHDVLLDATAYTSGVGSWGDVGAATGVLNIVLATQAWARGYAPHPSALVFGGSEAGQRCAVVVHREGME